MVCCMHIMSERVALIAPPVGPGCDHPVELMVMLQEPCTGTQRIKEMIYSTMTTTALLQTTMRKLLVINFEMANISPSTTGALGLSETSALSNVYAMALARLNDRVGKTITQEELDRFCTTSLLCTRSMALDALQVASAGHKGAHPTLRKFVRNLSSFFAPLDRFKSALDTFVQVSDPTCLIWGSIKVILTVCYFPVSKSGRVRATDDVTRLHRSLTKSPNSSTTHLRS